MIPNLEFHHVGIGTTEFDEAISTYESLGYRRSVVVDDTGLNVRIAFVGRSDSPWIEIVSPLGPGGPLASLISRKALPSPYHTCYATPDVDSTGNELRDLGFFPVGKPAPALAFGGARIAYHYHRATGLLELVERSMGSDDGIEVLRSASAFRAHG
jgi:methylmalonyl-CoA/ethylmalonyl-CoA epimerase